MPAFNFMISNKNIWQMNIITGWCFPILPTTQPLRLDTIHKTTIYRLDCLSRTQLSDDVEYSSFCLIILISSIIPSTYSSYPHSLHSRHIFSKFDSWSCWLSANNSILVLSEKCYIVFRRRGGGQEMVFGQGVSPPFVVMAWPSTRYSIPIIE